MSYPPPQGPPPGHPPPQGSPVPTQGYPPPGSPAPQPYGMPYRPPPPRRRSRWLTVGLPVAAVLVIGGIALGVWLLVGTLRDAVGPATDAADAYATALEDQRWDDAHGMLCDSSAQTLTPDDLAALHAQPELTGHHIEGVSVNSSNGRTTGQVELVFSTAAGPDDRMVLDLSKDGDAWRPCP